MQPALMRKISRGKSAWIIYDADGPQPYTGREKVIWSRRTKPGEDCGEYSWPADMRAEYERLLGRGEFSELPESQPVNLVELIADGDNAFDQKCIHGHRVEQHAVYCHNEHWLYAPRKCRRGEWFALIYGGEPSDYAHEKCPGFKPNPEYKEDKS